MNCTTVCYLIFYFVWKIFFYPRHLPTLTPTTHTHDPRPLPTTHDPRRLVTLLKLGLIQTLFVSPCPPECNFQSETKIEPDLRLGPIRNTYSVFCWNQSETILLQGSPELLISLLYMRRRALGRGWIWREWVAMRSSCAVRFAPNPRNFRPPRPADQSFQWPRLEILQSNLR